MRLSPSVCGSGGDGALETGPEEPISVQMRFFATLLIEVAYQPLQILGGGREVELFHHIP